MYTVNSIRNICLLGHSGSGKTALAESLLYMTGAIDRIGKNADGNTVCDYDPEEIRRHISISTSVVPLEYHNVKINLLDTPGAFDFSGAVMEAAPPTPPFWCALPRTASPLALRRHGNTAKTGTCPVSSTSPR